MGYDMSMMGWGPQVGLMGGVSLLFVALVVWSLFWKGLALWHSARKNQPWWFVALLVINTAGILDIIYLFVIAKIKPDRLFKK